MWPPGLRNQKYIPDEGVRGGGGVDALAAAIEDEGVAEAGEAVARIVVHRRVGAEEDGAAQGGRQEVDHPHGGRPWHWHRGEEKSFDSCVWQCARGVY